MLKEKAIEIKDLCKNYKMFNRKRDRLIETIIPGVKRHKEFSAISNMDLTIYKGDAIGILGRNGAGKSTLLKMITGVVTPSSGKIDVNGKISSLLELGAAFNTELTGEENIYQHGQVMGLTKKEIEEKKQDIINFADIGEHLYQPVKTYSSGMFARLAFACAINVDPDILIVDEVLSVGDMAFQLKCFKKFEEFKKKGKTLLFVTHNVSDVIRNCNRAIIISSGKKIFDGNVKDGVEKYKKIIVKLDDENDKEIINSEKSKKGVNSGAQENFKINSKECEKEKKWKDSFVKNPNMIEYGNGKAEVIDFGIFDTEGNILDTIDNNKDIVLKSKILFNEKIIDPIFTMTVKDFKGLDIMGTNTLIEGITTGEYQKGDTVEVEFKQKIKLAPNKYTLSFSCTHYNKNGELEVLDRKYDALLVDVTSDKDCVGLFRIDSDIRVYKR